MPLHMTADDMAAQLAASRRTLASAPVQAKFPAGVTMTVDEVAKVVGPEFKEMNENPPDSVVKVRENMQGKKADEAEGDTEAKFEEGKPADPTKNMSPEDAAEWKKQNELNKDKFKAAKGKTADRDWASMFPKNSYLNKFFAEKQIASKDFEVTDSQGVTHFIPNGVVVEAIAQTSGGERKKIEDTIRQIDFKNGDVNHFFAHLAKALAEQYSGALRFAGAEGDISAKFEEGKPADPTENMTPEQKAEWNKQKELHKDEFKGASTSSNAGFTRVRLTWASNARLSSEEEAEKLEEEAQADKEEAQAKQDKADAERMKEGARNDPFWMDAKYPGKDSDGKPFKKGDRVFYYPLTKTFLQGAKAEKASRDFDAGKADEDFMNRAAAVKATGLYGFTRATQRTIEATSRRLSKRALSIAKAAYSGDERVVGFLQTHAKRANSDSARLLLAAMREIGPKVASKTASGPVPLDPRSAIMYFDLVTEDYNIEEDAGDPDSDRHEEAKALMADPRKMLALEDAALKEVAALLGVRVFNEGHSSDGSLDCKFGVDSYEDVKKIDQILSRHHTGGDDEIGLNTPYMAARGFHLFPQGVNGPRFGPDGRDGDLEEWLEDNRPGRMAQDKTAAAVKESTRVGLYGFPSKTAMLGLNACTELRAFAGEIASDLHARRTAQYANMTGFLKEHAKQAKCGYAKMLLACYPDASVGTKVAAAPNSVREWLTWEE